MCERAQMRTRTRSLTSLGTHGRHAAHCEHTEEERVSVREKERSGSSSNTTQTLTQVWLRLHTLKGKHLGCWCLECCFESYVHYIKLISERLQVPDRSMGSAVANLLT